MLLARERHDSITFTIRICNIDRSHRTYRWRMGPNTDDARRRYELHRLVSAIRVFLLLLYILHYSNNISLFACPPPTRCVPCRATFVQCQHRHIFGCTMESRENEIPATVVRCLIVARPFVCVCRRSPFGLPYRYIN